LIKLGESFSLSSLLNQSQTYQGNPCGVYPDLSSFTGSGVIQTSVACIKQSTPTQVHIIWYQSFGSWYRFYPILSYFFFFVICLGSCFCPCSVICVLVYILFRFCLRLVFCYLRSCSCHVLVLVSCVFHTVKKKLQKKIWKKKWVFDLWTRNWGI